MQGRRLLFSRWCIDNSYLATGHPIVCVEKATQHVRGACSDAAHHCCMRAAWAFVSELQHCGQPALRAHSAYQADCPSILSVRAQLHVCMNEATAAQHSVVDHGICKSASLNQCLSATMEVSAAKQPALLSEPGS